MEDKNRKQTAVEIGDLVFELLVNCQRKEERLSESFHLTVPEFRCLRMFRGEDEVTIKLLTERMGLSGSRLTRIIDGLEKKSFVLRAFHDQDRRSILVRLTKKGVATARQLEERYIRIHEEILRDFPINQQQALSAGMRQLLRSLEHWLQQT